LTADLNLSRRCFWKICTVSDAYKDHRICTVSDAYKDHRICTVSDTYKDHRICTVSDTYKDHRICTVSDTYKDHRISSWGKVVQAVDKQINVWRRFRPVRPETSWVIPKIFYYHVTFVKELQDENGENYNPTGYFVWMHNLVWL